MLSIQQVSIFYGDRVLFDECSFTVGDRDRIGLVGRNGAGKSTMLKVVAGEIKPDEGQVAKSTTATIGYLHQDMFLPKGKTVMQETLSALSEIQEMERELERLTEEMTIRTDYESEAYTDLIIAHGDLSDRLHFMGGGSKEAEAERILKGLGFKQNDFSRLTDEFSGGWQMRIELCKMLLRQPDYLLLDEPTNHLDIESILWLENFLLDYPGAVVLISHDRQFLDNITKRTIEIELGNVYDYKASYTKYVTLRAERREKLAASYNNQQAQIAQTERLIEKFRAKANKAKMAQSLIKQLDRVDRIELEDEDVQTMNIRFPPAPRSGQIAVDAMHISKRYGSLSVLENVSLKLDRGDRVAFVGQNGQGKTTLAKILVSQEPATKGHVVLGHNVQVGYYAQNQADALQPRMTLLETVENASPPEMRTKVRAMLGAFMFSGDDVEKKVSVLSGGERARLALACMMLRPFNILLLDEPTNHLDMLSKDVLKHALMKYDGTLIVVSHDREFLDGLTNRTIEFKDGHLHEHLGDLSVFLEKRRIENMREIEKVSTTTNITADVPKVAAPVVTMTNEEKQAWDKRVKLVKRNAQTAEEAIARIEKEMAGIEAKMSEPTFYGSADEKKFLEKYKLAKKQLDDAYEVWEQANEEVELVGA